MNLVYTNQAEADLKNTFAWYEEKRSGTNPSLVEALGAGSPVLAHDNRFNRWVAGEGALFFSDEQTCDRQITKLLQDDELVEKMSAANKRRYLEQFTGR